jgi:hypothetical protein
MIRGDEVERAVLQCFPKQFVVRPFADRWRAFVFRGAIGDLFRAEDEVVRTGLGGDAQAALLRIADQRQCFRSGDVYDVDVDIELLAEADHEGDGVGLPFGGTARRRDAVG